MSDDPARTDLHCSFCRKSRFYVKALVAGPAVFICDQCVEACNAFIAAIPEGQPISANIGWPGDMPSEQLIGILKGQDSMSQELNERLRQTVDILRTREVSWAAIGDALGVSRQAAWERFS